MRDECATDARREGNMLLAGRAWNKLPSTERLELLYASSPNKNAAIAEMESELKWDTLLPSSQKALLEVDFSMVLGRDAQPL